MDLDLLKHIFYFKKESIGSIQFNEKIIKMILQTRIYINFNTHLLNTSSRI